MRTGAGRIPAIWLVGGSPHAVADGSDSERSLAGIDSIGATRQHEGFTDSVEAVLQLAACECAAQQSCELEVKGWAHRWGVIPGTPAMISRSDRTTALDKSPILNLYSLYPFFQHPSVT